MALSPVIGAAGFYNKSSGGGSPGGANTQIQFNNAGVFGGSASLTWTDATSLLTSGRLALTGVANSRLLDISGYSLTGSDATSMVNWVGTLNTTGSPNVIYANITNTASGGSTNLLRLESSSALRFNVAMDGEIRLKDNHGFGSFGANEFVVYVGGGAATSFQGGYNLVFYNGSPNAINFNSANPTVLAYDGAANTLAMKNGASAQTFRVYGTFTDTSNYVRASLGSSSTLVTLAAETAGTGADNIDINLTTAGTGLVNFATQAPTAEAVVSDATFQIKVGGTTYKILLKA